MSVLLMGASDPECLVGDSSPRGPFIDLPAAELLTSYVVPIPSSSLTSHTALYR